MGISTLKQQQPEPQHFSMMALETNFTFLTFDIKSDLFIKLKNLLTCFFIARSTAQAKAGTMNLSICVLKRSITHLSQRRSHAISTFTRTGGLQNMYLAPLIAPPRHHHQFQSTRSLKIDHINMSPLDVEKELFKLKRQMGAYYSKAAYAEALKVANELNREVLDIMGSNNAVHASCLNNIGLMQKMLGNKEEALKKYNESLDIYEEVVGKSHMSYVNTSANIGVLYKSMADSAESEEDYWKYLDLAEDILKKSLAARIDLHG